MRQVHSTRLLELCILSGGFVDLGLVDIYPSEALVPDKFLIGVVLGLAGKSAYVSAELREGADDIVLCSRLEAIKPSVSGGNVNWEESVAVAPHGGSIAVDCVHIEFVEEVAMTEFLFPLVGFGGGGKGTKSGGKFSDINEGAVFSGRDDVLGVAETETTKDAV